MYVAKKPTLVSLLALSGLVLGACAADSVESSTAQGETKNDDEFAHVDVVRVCQGTQPRQLPNAWPAGRAIFSDERAFYTGEGADRQAVILGRARADGEDAYIKPEYSGYYAMRVSYLQEDGSCPIANDDVRTSLNDRVKRWGDNVANGLAQYGYENASAGYLPAQRCRFSFNHECEVVTGDQCWLQLGVFVQEAGTQLLEPMSTALTIPLPRVGGKAATALAVSEESQYGADNDVSTNPSCAQ